jgi:hypothetical protein
VKSLGLYIGTPFVVVVEETSLEKEMFANQERPTKHTHMCVSEAS